MTDLEHYMHTLISFPSEVLIFWKEASLPNQLFMAFIVVHLFLLFLNVVAVGFPLKRHYKKYFFTNAITLVHIVCSEKMLKEYLPTETKASLHSKLNRFQIYLCYYLYGVGILILDSRCFLFI